MKYNRTPSARSKHITNSYLEATIEDHKNTTHFSETMMAPADNNNAMPPQPLVAPLDVDDGSGVGSDDDNGGGGDSDSGRHRQQSTKSGDGNGEWRWQRKQ